jgi:hypothetical protein
MARAPVSADNSLGVTTAERKAHMTAEVLKRKLRNFPVANLCQRITLA